MNRTMTMSRALVLYALAPTTVACTATPGDALLDEDDDFDDEDGRSEPNIKADDPTATSGSVCLVGYFSIDCEPETSTLVVDGQDRELLWRVPPGTPPTGGWPVVLALQGTNDPATKFFDWSYWSAIDQAYGGYYQLKTTQALLDAGFAVIAPEARVRAGGVYWDTNIPPYATNWSSSADAALFEQLFDEIAAGTFGPLDPSRQYAMGLSSGGYQASRLAVEYPAQIQAVALQSASYASCISSFPCVVTPADLPDDHPPTLLMAGYWDGIVPLYTIESYEEALVDDGAAVQLQVVGSAGHQWTSSSPGWVLSWFQTY